MIDTGGEEEPEAPPAKSPPARRGDSPGLDPDDSMTEAALKTLQFHFERMLEHEPGTRLGDDIEELHDMRVATRRMRASFPVFGEFLDMQSMKPFLKGLRRTGRALGRVRDLDVFQEKTEKYLQTLPADRQDDLKPLTDVWRAERDQARQQMLEYLDGKQYAQFKVLFGEILQPRLQACAPGIFAGWQPQTAPAQTRGAYCDIPAPGRSPGL